MSQKRERTPEYSYLLFLWNGTLLLNSYMSPLHLPHHLPHRPATPNYQFGSPIDRSTDSLSHLEDNASRGFELETAIVFTWKDSILKIQNHARII